MHHIDHPIVGDVNYGSGQINRHYRATYALHRLALHAVAIAFDHPVTGGRVEVVAGSLSDAAALAEQVSRLSRARTLPTGSASARTAT